MRQSFFWIRVIVGTFLIMGMAGSPVLAADDPEKDVRVQVLLGAARFSHMDLNYQSATDATVEAQNEITWMPMLGICGSLPFSQKSATFGFEGGGLVGWKNEDVTAYSGTTGSIKVHLKNKLYLVDLFAGPYMSAVLDQRMRFFAGAGPLFLFGQSDMHSDEFEDESQLREDRETSSAFGAGLYARMGVEYIMKDGSAMGLCVRGFTSRLDFENTSEDTDVKGVQILMTFTPQL